MAFLGSFECFAICIILPVSQRGAISFRHVGKLLLISCLEARFLLAIGADPPSRAEKQIFEGVSLVCACTEHCIDDWRDCMGILP
jgi:hypothetical protein